MLVSVITIAILFVTLWQVSCLVKVLTLDDYLFILKFLVKALLCGGVVVMLSFMFVALF